MQKIKLFLKRALAHLPSKLPLGMQDFDDFVESIIVLYNFPDDNTYRGAIATMIMHLDPLVTRKPKAWFAASIRKSMSNQIAYAKLQQYKNEKKPDIESVEVTIDASPANTAAHVLSQEVAH